MTDVMKDMYGKDLKIDKSLCQSKPNREKHVHMNMKILLYAIFALCVIGWIICQFVK